MDPNLEKLPGQEDQEIVEAGFHKPSSVETQQIPDIRATDKQSIEKSVGELGFTKGVDSGNSLSDGAQEGQNYNQEQIDSAMTKDISQMSSVEKEQAIQIITEQLKQQGVEYPNREFFDGFRSAFSQIEPNVSFDKLEMYRIMAQRPDLVEAIADDVSQGKSFKNFSQLKEFTGLMAGSKVGEMKDLYQGYKDGDAGFSSQVYWVTTDVDQYAAKQANLSAEKMAEVYGNWAIKNKLYGSNIEDFKEGVVVTDMATER